MSKLISDTDYKFYNDIQKRLKGISIEILKPEPIKDKWEPKEQKYYFSQDSTIHNTFLHEKTDIGRERSTKNLCKIASDRTIRANRISAWLDEFGSGEQTEGFYIYGSPIYGWLTSFSSVYLPDRVFMLKEDANKLCDFLNNNGKVF